MPKEVGKFDEDWRLATPLTRFATFALDVHSPRYLDNPTRSSLFSRHRHLYV